MSDTTNPPGRRPIWRALSIVALALAAGAFGAGALRYNLIESPGAAALCESGGLWWCPLRQWLVILFLRHAFGIAAVALAVIALLRPRVIWIALAAAASGIALMLYNADFGALAAVLAIFALLRWFGATRAR
ncbi:MAG: hypothetical protein SGJ07_11405 [Rhodospirillaceae bacterium]|nr:hypothetical protein [Rhodospirillaceae bacterium]